MITSGCIFLLFSILSFGNAARRKVPFNITDPDIWESKECDLQVVKFFERSKLLSPFGKYGDEFDYEMPWSYYPKRKPGHVKRKIYHGVRIRQQQNPGYPFTSICAIKKWTDDSFWCTCTIIHEIMVLSAASNFHERPRDSDPQSNIPQIKVTYGDMRTLKQNFSRRVIEMHYPPNKDIDVVLIKLVLPIVFHKRFVPFNSWTWVKTTGFKNLIPKCSTFACGYGKIEQEFSEPLSLFCSFFAFTTNAETLIANGVDTPKEYRAASRAYLASSSAQPFEYLTYVNNTDNGKKMSGLCIGDAGGPLLWFDKTTNKTFLMGIMLGHHPWHKCGQIGTDWAVSMMSIYGWLTKFFRGIPHPLKPKHQFRSTTNAYPNQPTTKPK